MNTLYVPCHHTLTYQSMSKASYDSIFIVKSSIWRMCNIAMVWKMYVCVIAQNFYSPIRKIVVDGFNYVSSIYLAKILCKYVG